MLWWVKLSLAVQLQGAEFCSIPNDGITGILVCSYEPFSPMNCFLL